jgi:hypothetical protein
MGVNNMTLLDSGGVSAVSAARLWILKARAELTPILKIFFPSLEMDFSEVRGGEFKNPAG